MYEKISGSVQEIITKVEDLVKEGNIRRILIKDQDGKIFIELPLLVGGIIMIAAPIVTAIGAVAGFLANFTIEITKKDNSEILLLCENNPLEEN